jgi:hypothetical protein
VLDLNRAIGTGRTCGDLDRLGVHCPSQPAAPIKFRLAELFSGHCGLLGAGTAGPSALILMFREVTERRTVFSEPAPKPRRGASGRARIARTGKIVILDDAGVAVSLPQPH